MNGLGTTAPVPESRDHAGNAGEDGHGEGDQEIDAQARRDAPG
jgi:hypothetical protein